MNLNYFQVYFDIDVDGTNFGRIIFGLFGEVVPDTVRNFKELADAVQGEGWATS